MKRVLKAVFVHLRLTVLRTGFLKVMTLWILLALPAVWIWDELGWKSRSVPWYGVLIALMLIASLADREGLWGAPPKRRKPQAH